MTHDEKMIRETFNLFVDAWQNRTTDQLDCIMEPDCEIDFSIFRKLRSL